MRFLGLRSFVVTGVALLIVGGCRSSASPRAPREGSVSSAQSRVMHDIAVLEDTRNSADGRLVELLGAGEPATASRAALALGRIQDPASIPALVKALNGPARREAIFALGQMGLGETWEPALATPITLALLQAGAQSSTEERPLICQSLGRLGDHAAVPFLAAAMESPDSAVRQSAAIALGRLKHPDVLAPLGSHVGDPDPEVRWRIAWALAYACDPKASDGVKEGVRADLRKLLGDTNATARAWACRGLGKLASVANWQVLLGLTQDSDWMVRVEACGAIEKNGGAEAKVNRASESSPHVRAAVARLEAPHWGSGQSLRDLHDEPSVRVAALEAWVKVMAKRLKMRQVPARNSEEAAVVPTGEGAAPVVDILRFFANEASPLVRAGAASSCALCAAEKGSTEPAPHAEGAFRIANSLTTDQDVRVQAAAVEALGAFGLDLSRAPLGAALASDDLSVRGSAVGALETIGGAEVVDPLIACYRNSTKREHVEVKEAIVDALAKIEDDRVNPFLLEACRDVQPSVRAKAVKALRARNQEVPADIPPPPPPEVSPLLDRALALLGKPAPEVEIVTSKGTMRAVLDPEAAPIHVANFLDLVGKKFYDNLRWHRVVPNFVIQGGDPRGDGWGDPGYSIRDEISDRHYLRGTIGMPKAGKDTGGCQIFIMHSPAPHLDGRYTIFGQVTEGLDVIDQIEVGDTILRIRRLR